MLLNSIPHPIVYSVDAISESDPNRSFVTCPISGKLMRNPVVASDGVTYDYDAIIRLYLKEENPESPTCPGVVLDVVKTLQADWRTRKRLMRMIQQSK